MQVVSASRISRSKLVVCYYQLFEVNDSEGVWRHWRTIGLMLFAVFSYFWCCTFLGLSWFGFGPGLVWVWWSILGGNEDEKIWGCGRCSCLGLVLLLKGFSGNHVRDIPRITSPYEDSLFYSSLRFVQHVKGYVIGDCLRIGRKRNILTRQRWLEWEVDYD